jgi:hypothetical protein
MAEEAPLKAIELTHPLQINGRNLKPQTVVDVREIGAMTAQGLIDNKRAKRAAEARVTTEGSK